MIFAEFTRFIIFRGLYFWLLTNAVCGHNIAETIIDSMQQLGGTAGLLSGASHAPSNILFAIAGKEGGKPGQWVRNNNGTHDVGSMQ